MYSIDDIYTALFMFVLRGMFGHCITSYCMVAKVFISYCYLCSNVDLICLSNKSCKRNQLLLKLHVAEPAYCDIDRSQSIDKITQKVEQLSKG